MRKSDLHLILGALSVTTLGLLLNPHRTLQHTALALLLAPLLVVLSYGFNRILDKEEAARFGYRLDDSTGVATRLLVLGCGALVLVLLTQLGAVARAAGAGIAILGVAYSLRLFGVRPKNLYVLKNVIIGLSWAGLVFVGADNVCLRTLDLFGLVTAQVFIGSVIRDLPDLAEDRAVGVVTLPARLGAPETLRVLSLLNVGSSVFLFALAGCTPLLGVTLIVALAWRQLVLVRLARTRNLLKWSSVANLATCHFLFLSVALWRLL